MKVNISIVTVTLTALYLGGWVASLVVFVLGMVLGTFYNLHKMGVLPISAAQNLWCFITGMPLPCEEALCEEFDSLIDEKWGRLENAGIDPDVSDAIAVVDQTLKDIESHPGKYLNMRKEKK